jgi:acetoin utilization deacetylase AcuC-like enzyme
MSTAIYTHPDCQRHEMGDWHPESPARLQAIADQLINSHIADLLEHRSAPLAELSDIERNHSRNAIAIVRDNVPQPGEYYPIDGDTSLNGHSWQAALRAAGAAVAATDAVIDREIQNAFCAIRPPGHHAEIATPMGFCLINTIAVVAREAQRKYGAERIAIVDFDVHHGNGTQDIFKADSTVFYASSHQMPLYPGTGKPSETGVGNITNVPLDPNSDGSSMREAYASHIIPALIDFSPDLILISAGFDAHERDPLAQLNWNSADFGWLTGKLMDVAERACGNRIVSLLEGGYDLKGLAGGASHHVAMLMDGAIGRLDD